MKLRYLYLVFAFLGLVLPYSQLVPWLAEHHALNMSILFQDLFANRISAFFGLDVIVSAVVLILFVQIEGNVLGCACSGCRSSRFSSSAFRSVSRCFFTCDNSSSTERERNPEEIAIGVLLSFGIFGKTLELRLAKLVVPVEASQ